MAFRHGWWGVAGLGVLGSRVGIRRLLVLRLLFDVPFLWLSFFFFQCDDNFKSKSKIY